MADGNVRFTGQEILRMVRIDLQRSEQKGLVTRFMAASLRLDSHEYGIDVGKSLRIVTL